jgi:transketolase
VRTAFIETLELLAEADSRIILMTGDLGFGVLNRYRERFPDQFYNVGVAEQNMAGVAAGLAMSGHIVFTYSIGNFPILRCLEQVRNDICYHEADVKVVSVGGGMAYGALGPSHYATEDLTICRALPGIAVVAPGDPVEVEQLVPQIVSTPGPVYLRLGRAGEARIHNDDVRVELGRLTSVRDGDQVLLLSTGGMLPEVVRSADALLDEGISAAVISVHSLAPFDSEALCEIAARFPLVITCEEHTVLGGLGGAVAEVLMEAGVQTRFRRFGLRNGFPEGVGSQEYLRRVNGIDADSLSDIVRSALQESK